MPRRTARLHNRSVMPPHSNRPSGSAEESSRTLEPSNELLREGSDTVWGPIADSLGDDTSAAVFSEEFFAEEISPVRIEDLRGARVLDGGCGLGRSVKHAANHAACAVGVDLAGASLRVAHRRAPAARLVQADLLRLPLRRDFFDVVYSFGVLQHTPSPRTAFLNLCRAARPGGAITIWVYSEEGNGIMRWIIEPLKRGLLRRFPKSVVWALSYPVTVVKWLAIHGLYLPAANWAPLAPLRRLLPAFEVMVFWGRSRSFRWLFASVYDFLTAPIASYHSRLEVEEWTTAAGLKDVAIGHRNQTTWKITGVRG